MNCDLTYNKQDLFEKIKKYEIKIFVLVHYCGFNFYRKDLADICQKNKIFLIEDFSHSFLSSFSNEGFLIKGEALIYSFRKNLPLPNGGIAIFNKKLGILESSQFSKSCEIKLIMFKYFFVRLVEFIITKFLKLNIYSRKI